MKALIRLSVIAAMGAGLVACGGRGAKLAAGEQNAAAALFQASGPASQAPGGRMIAGAQGIGMVGTQSEVKVDCSLGGSATLKMDLLQTLALTSGGQFGMVSTITYNDCQEATFDDPETQAVESESIWMNGDMATTLSSTFDYTDASAASGEVSIKLKGKVNFSGAIADFIDADVTQYVSFNALDADSGSVSVSLEGTIGTSTTATPYTYTRDTVITFDAATLAAASEDSGG